MPTISTLESYCDAFGITLSQFFSDSHLPLDLTDEQKNMLARWNTLTDKQKKILYELMDSM